MSHNILENDGIAYTGSKPWHGIGVELSPGADLDTWIREAGLDYDVKAATVGYIAKTSDGDMPKVAEDRKVIYRDDTGDWLEVLSGDYRIHQPREILGFYRELTEKQGFTMEVAGSMRNGRRIWGLAKSPEGFEIYGDQIKTYVLASTSFDGTGSSTFGDTAVRVVCNNTWDCAVGQDYKRWNKVSHRSVLDTEQVQVSLGLQPDQRALLIQSLKAFADTTINGTEKAEFCLKMVGPKETEARKKAMEKPNAAMETLFRTLNRGVGQDGIQDTAYGAFNAVTRFQDHERRQRIEGGRIESAWFGQGAILKQQAWDYLVNQCVERHNVNADVFAKAA